MSMFGALVGAAIDRSDGDSGIKGALIGAAAAKTAKAVVPLAVTFVIGLVVQKAAMAGWHRLAQRR